MKSGRTIQELAKEITRQQEAKRDFVADTRQLSMVSVLEQTLQETERRKTVAEARLRISSGSHSEDFAVTDHAHDQLSGRLKIPRPYYQRLLREHPDMLNYNVTQLFQRAPERRMIRTLDGAARAFLSDRYRRVDNFDVLQAVLPILGEFQDARVESCDVTGLRLYLKVVFPRVEGEVQVGDVVQSGFSLSNSEVGAGSIAVDPLLFRLRCQNGMTVVDTAGVRRRHVGPRIEGENGDEAFELFSDETLQADDKALIMKIRDTVRATANEQQFKSILQRARDATSIKIKGSPVENVEVLANRHGWTQDEKGSILQHLIEGGDLSAWGYANAVTRTAQDVPSYDRSNELEVLGGDLINQSEKEWKLN